MHDVLILGAGPAGGAVARRLAGSGMRVALIGGDSRAGWEGLSERSRTLLAEEGIESRVSIVGPCERRGAWGAERTVGGREWLIERQSLAAAFRAAADAAGAQLHDDTVVEVGRTVDAWTARLRTGGALSAPQVIDARGRRGASQRGPVLLSIGRKFRSARRAMAGTQIHALDFGWCWWGAALDGLWVQVVAGPRRGAPASWIESAARQIPALARALGNAVPSGECVARPAHARHCLPPREASYWRVGDAAVSYDPLSGQGVYEALRGAQLVAAAVRGVIEGDDPWLAQRFVADRYAATWESGVRAAAGFYRENVDRGAFWSETAAAYERWLPVNRAFRPAVERRPVLSDGRIRECDVIVTPEHPRGVWQVDGVPLVLLQRYLASEEGVTVTGAAAAFERPPAAVAAAIHWLQKTGMVGALEAAPSVEGRLN